MTPEILRKCDVVRRALDRLDAGMESPSLGIEQQMAWTLQADNVREILDYLENDNEQ